MAVPSGLLKQLLTLGEHERVEIAHALLSSVADAGADDGLSAADRAALDAALDQSFDEIEAGKAIPFDEAMASLRTRRARQARG
jgi:hypothetical protein